MTSIAKTNIALAIFKATTNRKLQPIVDPKATPIIENYNIFKQSKERFQFALLVLWKLT